MTLNKKTVSYQSTNAVDSEFTKYIKVIGHVPRNVHGCHDGSTPIPPNLEVVREAPDDQLCCSSCKVIDHKHPLLTEPDVQEYANDVNSCKRGCDGLC